MDDMKHSNRVSVIYWRSMKGLAGVTKGEDITSPFTSIMGKTFMIVEETLAGNPIAKMTYIYTRL